MINSYTSLDLETTGLDPKEHKIIEIGAVKVKNGKITDRFSSMVLPGRRITERITQITGITQEDLVGAPQIEDVLPDLLAFIGEDILLGHSVLFDYSFVKKAATNLDLPFEKQAVDTLKLARKYLKELESRSLPFLCKHFEIPHHAHRALADAEATHVLYRKLVELFGEKEDFAATEGPLPMFYKVKKETPVTKPQKERLYRLIAQHKLIVDYDVEKLTRNEASRFTDRILAEYGR